MEAMRRSASVRNFQRLEKFYTDHNISDEGEDPSLIDKAGNKYIEQNGTYVKVQAASHRDRPTSGDEDDEGYEEGDMEESVRDRRSTRQQQSTHQTSTGGGLKDEPLSEYDEDGATMTQNMSADNFEPHEHMDQFDGEDESLSQAVDKKPLKSLNPLNSAPTHASILDDVIAAGELQRELDDHEHPDSINDKKQALEESRKTAAAEKIKQQQQIKRLASAKAYGFDQLPASPALDYGEPMPHHSSSTMNFNRYSASEGSFSTSQGLPSNRRRSGANRDTLGSTAFNTPGYRAPGQPSTRWPRDERSLSPKESQTRRDESLLHVITRDA
jgi:hypothetical protein